MNDKRHIVAERYFRGVYSGDPSVVDALAAEDIVCSYPIFERLFGTPALRGRQALKAFVRRFGSRWAEPQLTVHETVAEGARVVLLWSFRARSVDVAESAAAASRYTHEWGGITLFRFDDAGKIAAEIGEESTPGPWARGAGVAGIETA